MSTAQPSRPAPAAAAPSLNGLDDELLNKVLGNLDSQALLSVVPFVCKRWHGITVSSPTIWQDIYFETVLQGTAAELDRLRCFGAWVQQRASHVKSFTFVVMGATIDVEVDEEAAAHQQEVWSTLEGGVLASLAAAGSIAELNLEWYGEATLGPWAAQLTSLKSLGIDAHSVKAVQPLSALTALTSMRLKASLGACDLAACTALPERLQSIALSWQEPAAALPPALASLSRLKRLQLSHARLAADGLAMLPQLPQLEELAINECKLPALPLTISTLTNLRALYMDSNPFRQAYGEGAAVLETVLSELTALRVLGLSDCRLAAIPPCLLERQNLVALYLEENRIPAVPDCALLRRLHTLSLDWMPALESAALLRQASGLAQLYVCRPPSWLAQSELLTQEGLLEARADVLMDALLALPRLQSLTFVLYEDSRLRQRVPVGNAMLRMTARLARARPEVRVDMLAQSSFFALTADQAEKLEAELGRH